MPAARASCLNAMGARTFRYPRFAGVSPFKWKFGSTGLHRYLGRLPFFTMLDETHAPTMSTKDSAKLLRADCSDNEALKTNVNMSDNVYECVNRAKQINIAPARFVQCAVLLMRSYGNFVACAVHGWSVSIWPEQ